jgi:hypothetical protein
MRATEVAGLKEFGFSGLEAETYLTLLRLRRATGYRVGQVLGKPVANVYKALDSLQRKGAVLVDESSKSRVFCPLPITEYLQQQASAFAARRTRLEARLERYAASSIDEGIFPLETIEQVYDRAARLTREATQVILVDAFPGPLRRIEPDLERAASSGVKVLIRSYGQPADPRTASSAGGTPWVEARQGLPVEWLNVVVDGREHVLALIDAREQTVVQAVWSKSRFLSLYLHNGAFCEIVLNRLLVEFAGKDIPAAELRSWLETFGPYRASQLPAFAQMIDPGVPPSAPQPTGP